MQDLRTKILFFNIVENYYSELKNLNVLTKTYWTKQNKTIVQSSHPPKEAILIIVNKQLLTASHFKQPETEAKRKIVVQNNYTNKCLHTIKDQLDKIETIIDTIDIIKQTIKKSPLIKIPEVKQGLSLKSTSTKTQEKIDQKLKELAKIKPEQGEPSNIINVIQKGKGIKFETSSFDLETSSDEEINKLEEAFGKL